MKNKFIPILLLIVIAAVFSACNNGGKVSEKITEATTKVLNVFTTAMQTVEETTAEITTLISETTTFVQTETTERITAATTKKPNVATTVSGRIYKEKKVEEDSRYGVSVHLYKTIRYQLIDGERVDISSEYTDISVNRSFYSAEYNDLLPAARQNRETYRAYINEVLRIVNGYRAAEGIAPLTLSEELTVMSCVRAEEVAWSGDHDHTRPGYKSFKTVFKEAGFETGLAGENIGWGYATPEAVCEAWKNSKTHYANIMNPEFTQIGIGVAADPDPSGKLCWTQHFHEG